MRRIWRETVRDARWFVHSRAALALGVVAIVAAGWGALSATTAAIGAIDTFHDTLDRYRQHGLDVAGALAAPSGATGDAANQVIDNPLRYDLEQAAAAYLQVQPVGAIATTLSLSALLVCPLVGFVVGIFLSTHDVTSGSIVFRWPQAGIVPFAVSKPVMLVVGMSATVATTALLAVAASVVAQSFVRPVALDIGAFTEQEPSLGTILLIGSIAVLTGCAAGALGMLVGALTRNRTFTVAGFALVYALLPIVGDADPRNLVARVGADVYLFPGEFTLQSAGHLPPAIAAMLLAACTVGFVALSVIPWTLRSRTERWA